MRRILLLFVVLFAFGTTAAHAEEMTRDEILAKFHEDIGLDQDALRNFAQSVQPFMVEMQQKMMQKMVENKDNMTPTLQAEILTDAMTNMGGKIQAEAKKTFSKEQHQKLNLRMFQLMQGTQDGAAKSNDPNVIIGAMGGNTLMLAAGQPDFLELTADQIKQVQTIQRDVAVKSSLAIEEGVRKSMEANPESQKKLNELYAKLQDATPEEQSKISDQIQQLQNERLIPAMNDLKKLLAEGKTCYTVNGQKLLFYFF